MFPEFKFSNSTLLKIVNLNSIVGSETASEGVFDGRVAREAKSSRN